ncbi:MAG: hypothetical protein IJ391_04740, partial [Clostridia bacterium]|nr:hypothetical protein [Clostridia bacterium]
MVKVTLLGDSIRQIGYGKVVPEMLGDGYEVFQPGDNCRFAKYTLRLLYDLRNDMAGSDIVHWNNGLWDTCDIVDGEAFTSIDEYVENMVRIARILKSRHKTVIFATITAVDERIGDQKNERIKAYNDALVPRLEEMGVIINDLYSLVYPNIDKYICDDRVHLSQDGIEACGRQVT